MKCTRHPAWIYYFLLCYYAHPARTYLQRPSIDRFFARRTLARCDKLSASLLCDLKKQNHFIYMQNELSLISTKIHYFLGSFTRDNNFLSLFNFHGFITPTNLRSRVIKLLTWFYSVTNGPAITIFNERIFQIKKH